MTDLNATAHDDSRFEPQRVRAAAWAVLQPLHEVCSDDELVELWTDRFERWLPMYWRRSRLPGVPGGWGADVRVSNLEVSTLRSVGTTEAAEVVVRARLRVRRWPRIAGFGPLVRGLQRGGPELWLTLSAAPAGDWQLRRVDFNAAGEHHLAAETVLEPTENPALRDTALRELAENDSSPDPRQLLIGTHGAAAERALDLSLADGRFAPTVVEAAIRSIFRTWRRFALGDRDAFHDLAALSSYEVADYARSADLPASLRSLEIVELTDAPRVALFARIAAVVQGRDGARDKILWWKLELDDDLGQHWRLVDAYARPELRALRADFNRPKPNPDR